MNMNRTEYYDYIRIFYNNNRAHLLICCFFSTDSTKHTNKASHNHFKIILRFPCYFGLSCLSPEMHLEDTHLCSNPFVPRFILTPHSSHYHCLMPHNIYTGICEMHKIIIKIWLKWIFPCLFVLFSISCIPAGAYRHNALCFKNWNHVHFDIFDIYYWTHMWILSVTV